MTIDVEFLREVQAKGWLIKAVDKDVVIAACPRAGCGLTTKLQQGRKVPASCGSSPALAEATVTSFEDARVFMRERRFALGLTIPDVEAAAGTASTFLAKWEKDNPSKIPNAETFIEWIQSLGYEVVLRPATLPPYTLRIISETRNAPARRKKDHDRIRRQGRQP